MEKEEIKYRGKTLAIILRKNLKIEGVNFCTKKESPLQLGISSYKKGQIIKPHIHLPVKRLIKTTAEMVYLQQGEMKIYFYNQKGKILKQKFLKEGDVVLFLEGGHGMKITKTTRIIEIKQGPYISKKKDKKILEENS